ncbi:MAG: FAD-dependent oxidoreductase, partial [Holosporales bacterium]|nr:FAD-dependent oxidoreductase [Holosporales bacterium]
MEKTAQIIVIGGGPGGYVAAIRAAQLGFSVVCVDKKASLGGTCLNEGCIPSKALLHASSLYQETHSLGSYGIDIETVSLNLKTLMARKDSTVKELTQGIDFLFRKNKITRLIGMAQLGENNTVILKREGTPSEVWTAEKAIIIATGSEPIVFPDLEVDEKTILLDATSKYADLNILPVRDLNSSGRLIKKDGSSAEIDLMPKSNSKDVINIMATISAEGEVSGKIREQYF